MLMDAFSIADHSEGHQRCEAMHRWFCFAGQAAPCEGLFPDNMLPCVCGAMEDLISALGQVAEPYDC